MSNHLWLLTAQLPTSGSATAIAVKVTIGRDQQQHLGGGDSSSPSCNPNSTSLTPLKPNVAFPNRSANKEDGDELDQFASCYDRDLNSNTRIQNSALHAMSKSAKMLVFYSYEWTFFDLHQLLNPVLLHFEILSSSSAAFPEVKPPDSWRNTTDHNRHRLRNQD